MPVPDRLRAWLSEWGSTVVAFLAPLTLYAVTATRTVQGGDVGEFATVGFQGGVPHPPGYPLYAALSRLFGLLPLGSPAFRIALCSATLAAAAVAVLERALRRATGGRFAAFGAALAFGLMPLTWRLAGVPEVFSMNSLLVATLFLCALRLGEAGVQGGYAPSPGKAVRASARAGREGALLGLTLGLGMANHQTIVLCAPMGVAALWLVWRKLGTRGLLVVVGAGAAGGLVGLLAYLYLPFASSAAAPGDWVWGHVESAHGLLRHFLRSDYGTFQLASHGGKPQPWAQIGRYLATLPGALLYIYAAAGVAGFVVALRRSRVVALGVIATFALSGLVFVGLANLHHDDISFDIGERFYLLPNLCFAILVGFALAEAEKRLTGVARRLLLLAPIPLMVVAGIGEADWSRDPTVERYLVAALEECAPNAVVLGLGDAEGFGFLYVKNVLHIRPDVRYVDVNLVRIRFYYDRIRREVPELTLPFDPRVTFIQQMVDQLQERAPLYLTPLLAGNAQLLPVYPEGLLARVRKPGAPVPPPAELEATVGRAFERFLPIPNHSIDSWGRHIRDAAAAQWDTLAAAYDRLGDHPHAAELRARSQFIIHGD